MKESWKTYRITWLLYAGIIILPIVFVLSIGQLNKLESDTKAIRQIARSGGDILAFTLSRQPSVRKKYRQNLNRTFDELSRWFAQVGKTDFYVGEKTPQKDFADLKKCWSALESNPTLEKGLECREKARALSFATERMIALEIDKIRSTLYVTLAGSIIFLLLLILFVREYIHYQLTQQAIRDHETGLLNRKYCDTSFQKHCARAERYKHPLSTLSIAVPHLESFQKGEREQLLADLGAYLKKVVRKSDIACRYNTDLFLLILPDTPADGADILGGRIENELTEKIRNRYPNFSFTLQSRGKNEGESCEDFLRRSVS